MIVETSRTGRKLFPVVTIRFRTATRSAQVTLPPAVQASALAAAVSAGVALAYLGISQIGYIRLLGDEQRVIARAESANVDLQDDVASLRDRLAVAARDRAVAEDRISALASEAGTLRDQLELIERKLIAIEQKASERQTLRTTEQATEAGPVEPVPSQLTPSEATPAHPEGSARDLSAEAKRSAESVAELSRRAIGEFKRVLASAGVDVARLFSRFGDEPRRRRSLRTAAKSRSARRLHRYGRARRYARLGKIATVVDTTRTLPNRQSFRSASRSF